MRLKNLTALVAAGALAALPGCKDYLDVDALSSFTHEYVYSIEGEVEMALNGVYAQALSDNTYGSTYENDLCLLSDVDVTFSQTSSTSTDGFRRFDCNAEGGTVRNYWRQQYKSIEAANDFIKSFTEGPLYDEKKLQHTQWLGEAKVLRAMFYHDLVIYFGDIPFSLKPSADMDDYVMEIEDRQTILKTLIDDLKEAEKGMMFADTIEDGIERVSREMCWSMIARMALTAGGYSLRPNKSDRASYGTMQRDGNYQEYYRTAREYAKKVIDSGKHSLSKRYRQVFIDECNYVVNNDDDPIFEIPFAKNSTGQIGYIYGPKADALDGETPHQWGSSSGSLLMSQFLRFSYPTGDARAKYLFNYWNYANTGYATAHNDYGLRNNKWSKLWANTGLGATTSTQTGINYPYMRYADVLLMFAEAENEINGATADAIDALRQVHLRGMDFDAAATDEYMANVPTDKEGFLKAVLDERKWEFPGENMRWRDLVRNNLYSEALYYEYIRYFDLAWQNFVGGTSKFYDAIEQRDAEVLKRYNTDNYTTIMPQDCYYHMVKNPNNPEIYPNTTLPVIEFAGYYAKDSTTLKDFKYLEQTVANNSTAWNAIHPDGKNGDHASGEINCTKQLREVTLYNWGSDGDVNNYIKFWMFGFIRYDEEGRIGPNLVRDGKIAEDVPVTATNLPVVRYILPYPTEALQRAAGKYVNYYGY